MASKEPGKCPYCNNTDINYYDTIQEDNHFDYKCTCNKCKKEFRECYDLTFVGMFDEDGGEKL